jgi:hypothetical protein
MVLAVQKTISWRDNEKRVLSAQLSLRTCFSDDRLPMKNPIQCESIFILVTIALEKGA